MIDNIQLTNFQGHTDTYIEFDPGFNVIVGSTNSGKSSIVRAFKWAILNKPTTGFKNWYAKTRDPQSVAINFNDGWLIRERVGQFNGYRGFSEAVGENFEFKKIDKDLPTEVMLTTDMNEVNIQGQHEKFFMLQDMPPGQIGKRISEAVHLEIIDDVRVKADTFVTQITSRIKTTNATIEQTKQQIDRLKHIDVAETLISEIESHRSVIHSHVKKRDFILQHAEPLVELYRDRKEMQEWLEIKNPAKSILGNIKYLKELREDKERIRYHTNMIRNHKVRIDYLRNERPPLKDVRSIQKDAKRLNDMQEKRGKIIDVCDSIRKHRKALSISLTRLDALKKQEKQIRSSVDICPFCKRSMKNDENSCNGGRSHNGSKTKGTKRQLLKNRREKT